MSATAVAQEVTVRIGHVAPTSGWMSIVGIESENGARLAVAELNAQHLRIGGRAVGFELVAADDLGTPDRARAAAQALVRARVSGVVGHLTSGSTIAAAKIYADAGIPLIAPSATNPLLTRMGVKSVFRLVPDDAVLTGLLVRFVVSELRLLRFAVIDDGGVSGRSAAEAFSSAVVAAGGRVVVTRRTTEDASDFGEFLSAIGTERVDAVYVGGFEPLAGRLIRQMKQRNIVARVLTSDAACTQDLISYYARGEAFDEQVVCVLPGGTPPVGDPSTARFIAAYAQRYGIEPQWFGAHTYDGVMLIAEAMRRAGSIEPAAYLPLVAATRDYLGATGRIGFDDHGELRDPTAGAFTYSGETRRLIRIVR